MKWVQALGKAVLRVLLVLVLMVAWGSVENCLLFTTRITVPSQELPRSFQGFKVAQVSDLHNKVSPLLLPALKASEPDIIAITGDLIDSYQTDVEAALAFVREAVTIAPCYYVTGNHESRMPEAFAILEAGLREAGVTILRGEAVTLEQNGESISLLGLDDTTFGRSMDSQLEGLSPERYTLMLVHRPELFDTYCKYEPSLILAGHTHGGQFRLPFLGGVLIPNQGFFARYDAGLFTREDTTMYISRGLANSSFPFRLLNPPELVVVTLTSA